MAPRRMARAPSPDPGPPPPPPRLLHALLPRSDGHGSATPALLRQAPPSLSSLRCSAPCATPPRIEAQSRGCRVASPTASRRPPLLWCWAARHRCGGARGPWRPLPLRRAEIASSPLPCSGVLEGSTDGVREQGQGKLPAAEVAEPLTEAADGALVAHPPRPCPPCEQVLRKKYLKGKTLSQVVKKAGIHISGRA
jgi:hypothetical protein